MCVHIYSPKREQFGKIVRLIPTWQWVRKQLHEPILAVLAILSTTGKVRWPPLSQLSLEALTSSLRLTCQQLGFAEIALYVAPQVWELVHAVTRVVLILEHCKIRSHKTKLE